MGAGVCFADSHGEDGIRDEPDNDHVGSDSSVVVFVCLLFRGGRGGDFNSISQIAKRLVVAGIDVELLRWHFELNNITSTLSFGGAKISGHDVISFGSPGNIVRIAESVDLECTNIGWQ